MTYLRRGWASHQTSGVDHLPCSVDRLPGRQNVVDQMVKKVIERYDQNLEVHTESGKETYLMQVHTIARMCAFCTAIPPDIHSYDIYIEYLMYKTRYPGKPPSVRIVLFCLFVCQLFVDIFEVRSSSTRQHRTWLEP